MGVGNIDKNFPQRLIKLKAFRMFRQFYVCCFYVFGRINFSNAATAITDIDPLTNGIIPDIIGIRTEINMIVRAGSAEVSGPLQAAILTLV